MNQNVMELGDMIRVDRIVYKHVGIYVGSQFAGGHFGDVIHNDKFGGVVLSSLMDFSGGAPIFIHKKASDNFGQRLLTVQRALSLIGRKYDLLTFNCEHVANYAQTGKAESPQLQGFALLALLLFGIGALARQ